MDEDELFRIVGLGETFTVQFKEKMPHRDSTVEEMKYGNTIVRNPLIAGFAMRTMPFSGLGTGINRALERRPDIELLNDADGEQFKIVIPWNHL